MSDEFFARFARNGTWFTPALVAYRSFMQETVDLAPPRPAVREGRGGPRFERFVELVGRMRRSGVKLLAGTDFGPHPSSVPYPVPSPGGDLHDELELFVRAGLTPLEALQAATSGAARHVRARDRLGTIEVGKEADLVLLDADPLENVANTRRIRAVVVRGMLLDRRVSDHDTNDPSGRDINDSLRNRSLLRSRPPPDEPGGTTDGQLTVFASRRSVDASKFSTSTTEFARREETHGFP